MTVDSAARATDVITPLRAFFVQLTTVGLITCSASERIALRTLSLAESPWVDVHT